MTDCPTGKITFASRGAAARSRGLRRNQGRPASGAYLCNLCHGWHLTTEAHIQS